MSFEEPQAAPSQPITPESEQEIPVLPGSQQDELPAAIPAVQFEDDMNQSQTRTVRVSTDRLQIWIDRLGGDITRVDLPDYPQALDKPDIPFVLLDPRNRFVAQTGLIGQDGPDAQENRPLYTSFSDEYVLAESDSELVVDLRYQDPLGVSVTKRFKFQRDNSLVGIEYAIVNSTNDVWQGNLFAQFKRDSQSPAVEETNSMGLRPYVGGALFTPDSPYHKLEFDDLEEAAFRQDIRGGYIAMVQHYFVSAFIPPDQDDHVYQARMVSGKDLYLMGYTGSTLQIPAGMTGSIATTAYFGPKHQKTLGELSKGLDLTVDYGFLWWIAQPLFSLLEFIHGVVRNWGLAIVILTVIVKIVLYPLSAASFKSMAKMRKLQPEMARLKERYGDDRQKFSQAMMDLYRKEGANPLGGCLPMLVQMPVFLALYWTLMESVELRQAPLALWIQDLSVMDPYFILPILMGGSMFLTTMMNPEPPDPMQAKVMKMMPIMFTFFFLWVPVGTCALLARQQYPLGSATVVCNASRDCQCLARSPTPGARRLVRYAGNYAHDLKASLRSRHTMVDHQ